MTTIVQRPFADVTFNPQGTPVAESFDDVYFSNDDGVAESIYVFLENNQLPKRWENIQDDAFVIAETGFGSGLNFLVTAEAFINFANHTGNSNQRSLHFISTEKFPMRASDAKNTLQHFSQLCLSDSLIVKWPMNTEGCHRLTFQIGNATITLDLWIGDVLEQLPQIQNKSNGLIDAWFLDGFAPSKNPEMWQPTLFDQMYRLSKPTATFATFTAAGIVKRGLRNAGFKVEKRKGFGRKRDMLAGFIDAQVKPVAARNNTPFFNRDASSSDTKHLVIAGGGLAAASLCLALAKRGVRSTLLVKDQAIAQGASGNPQGGFYPQLNAKASIISQIQLNSFLYAKNLYRELLSAGHNFSHEWCGVLLIGFSKEVLKRQQNLVESDVWPSQIIHPVCAERASEIAGVNIPYSSLYVSQGGWLSPPELVKAMLGAAMQLCEVNIITNTNVTSYHSQKGVDGNNTVVSFTQEQPQHSHQQSITADALVIATGHATNNLPGFEQIPTALTRGQVEAIPTQSPLHQLTTVLCHKGYLTPAMQGQHALGSTYIKQDIDTHYRRSEEQQNLSMHARSLADCDWAHALQSNQHGRAAIRCSTPDHLPLVGALPDLHEQQHQYANYGGKRPHLLAQQPSNVEGVYMLTGLGSRGLTTAPLMAELLASQILGLPIPLANPLLDALNPNRFLLRKLKRS